MAGAGAKRSQCRGDRNRPNAAMRIDDLARPDSPKRRSLAGGAAGNVPPTARTIAFVFSPPESGFRFGDVWITPVASAGRALHDETRHSSLVTADVPGRRRSM